MTITNLRPNTMEVRPLASVAAVMVSNVDKLSKDGEIPVRLCSYTDVYKNEDVHPGLELMEATATLAEIRRFRLKVGDTVFTKDSETADDIGVPAFVTGEADDLVCGYHLAIARPDPEMIDPKYLYWWLASREAAEQWENRASGVTRVGLRQPDIRGFPLTMHREIPTQREIADFLDRETAQVDAMIEAQRELVAALEERRRAVFDAAFRPLRDNQVELRRVVDLVTSGSRGWAEFYADSGERFLRIGNLSRGELEIRGEVQHVDLPRDELEGARTRLQEGDLLFSITAFLGSVAVVDGSWTGAYVSQHVGLCRLRSTAGLDPRFVGYYMLSTDGQDQLKEGAYGGTKLQLSLGDLRALTAPVAPPSLQLQVVSHLEAATAGMDAMIDAANDSIAFMRERRSAMISAAVTGRIDPRTGREYPQEDL